MTKLTFAKIFLIHWKRVKEWLWRWRFTPFLSLISLLRQTRENVGQRKTSLNASRRRGKKKANKRALIQRRPSNQHCKQTTSRTYISAFYCIFSMVIKSCNIYLLDVCACVYSCLYLCVIWNPNTCNFFWIHHNT